MGPKRKTKLKAKGTAKTRTVAKVKKKDFSRKTKKIKKKAPSRPRIAKFTRKKLASEIWKKDDQGSYAKRAFDNPQRLHPAQRNAPDTSEGGTYFNARRRKEWEEEYVRWQMEQKAKAKKNQTNKTSKKTATNKTSKKTATNKTSKKTSKDEQDKQEDE